MSREPSDVYTASRDRTLAKLLAAVAVCAYSAIGVLLYLLCRVVTS